MTDTGNGAVGRSPRSEPEVAAQQERCGMLPALRRNQAALGEFLDVLQEARYLPGFERQRAVARPPSADNSISFRPRWRTIGCELDAMRAAG